MRTRSSLQAPQLVQQTSAPDAVVASNTPDVGNAAMLEQLMASGGERQGNEPGELGVDDVRGGTVIDFMDRGELVVDLQQKLTRLGYGVQATGIMGETTMETLRAFQRNNRIADTGQLGPTTLEGLERALEASITVEELRDVAPDLDDRTLRTYLPYLNASMAYADISNPERKAAYLAQLAHETDHFRTFEEYASGAAYEGRDDLGNHRPGDGRRYKGRGAIQLTGRANYREIGQRLGVDFESHPELLERPEYAFLASADYWKRHDLNELADQGDFEGITDVINYYDPEERRRMRRAHHRRARTTLSEHAELHENAPGTIGGEQEELPWWAEEEPEHQEQPTEKQAQYGDWLEQVLGGHALATRDAVAVSAASYRAENGLAPDAGDTETADAGLMWQLADAYAATFTLGEDGDQAGVMAKAHQAAERARDLRDAGLLDPERAEQLIRAMGATYTAAKEASAAGSQGQEAPIIDQHRMNHERNWAFCGIATLLMTLEANGVDPDVDIASRSDLVAFAQGIYIPGSGSSGAGMASRMRQHGIEGASFGTGGSIASITAMLAEGKTVPAGFVSMGGEVVELPQSSARYPGLRQGARHDKRFGPSGHWAMVVGFDGPAEDPTHFYVNDPDTGARLRMSRAELERHTAAHEGIWNIGY